VNARELIDWWLRPWQEASAGPLARAGRIYLFAAAMVLLVTPGMVLYYGADGWLWELTASVILFAPLGMTLCDALVHRIAGRGRRLVRLVALFVGTAVGVLAGYGATLLLPSPPISDVGLLVRDYRRTMGILSMVFAATGVLGSVLWLRAETYRLKSAVDSASFQTLKGQLQPHFLFNALSSLKELIADDPERAGEVTQRIADLYRLILAASRAATTSLGEELAIVESYCEVERVRYGERLRYAIDVPVALRDCHVPSLMVQILVENAVKHGVCKARQGGEVRVHAARVEGGGIEVIVQNTGAPYAPSARASMATGIANTISRLELMYGGPARFTIGPDDEGGTRARFVVSGERVA
jgi:hypothetical protein